ncbi:MAG: hypothetical protein H7A24_03020 [Leptospiraceae bacterium]|nr:hypothetical protein [Leptospiraceae bacterium]
MIDYKRIKKECFWDLSFTEKDIEDIINGNEPKQKNFLLEKILINSTKLFYDLKGFDKEELSHFLNHYLVPSFNADYISRRKNLVEVFFFDKPLLIEELKWIT